MHVDALYVDNQHGYVSDTNTTKTVFSMHAPSTLHGALWWGAVNIVWVITHECAGHNSQHSCCLCNNSQGTPSQDQWDLFFQSFQPQYSSMAEKTIAISLPGVWPSIWWKFYNFIRKRCVGVVEGCPGYWARDSRAGLAIVARAFMSDHPTLCSLGACWFTLAH